VTSQVNNSEDTVAELINNYCNGHEECNPGQFCKLTENGQRSGPLIEDKGGVCLDQRKEGEQCTEGSDFSCENHLGCLLKNVCTKYGYLKDFESSDNELLCQSGFVGPRIGSSTDETICLPSPSIKDK